MFGLQGSLKAKAGKRDELAEILRKASALMTATDDCFLYLVGKDLHDEQTVVITEVWVSKEAHSGSLQNPQVKEMIMQAMPLLDGPPQRGHEFEVTGGFPIE